MVSMDREYLTIYEVAAMYPGNNGKSGLCHETVRRWITRGRLGVKLQSVVRGGRRVIRPSDLEAFDRAVERRMNAGEEFAGHLADAAQAIEDLKRHGIG